MSTPFNGPSTWHIRLLSLTSLTLGIDSIAQSVFLCFFFYSAHSCCTILQYSLFILKRQISIFLLHRPTESTQHYFVIEVFFFDFASKNLACRCCYLSLLLFFSLFNFIFNSTSSITGVNECVLQYYIVFACVSLP